MKHLEARGEMDYDYINDNLFFKVKEREYNHSIELDDIMLDVDSEGYITGLQIFGASTMFNVDKETLKHIKQWEFRIRIEGKIVSVQLLFKIVRRNKLVECGQNVIRETSSLLTNSEVLCKMEA